VTNGPPDCARPVEGGKANETICVAIVSAVAPRAKEKSDVMTIWVSSGLSKSGRLERPGRGRSNLSAIYDFVAALQRRALRMRSSPARKRADCCGYKPSKRRNRSARLKPCRAHSRVSLFPAPGYAVGEANSFRVGSNEIHQGRDWQSLDPE
jgi:hypothetical protein